MAEAPESFWTRIKHKEMAVAAFVMSGYIAFAGVDPLMGPSWLRIAAFFFLVPFFAALIFKLFNWEEVSFLRMMGWSYLAILGVPALLFLGLAIIFLVVVSLIHHFGWWLLLLVPLLYIPTIVISLWTLFAVAKIVDWLSILWKTSLSRREE